MYDLYTGAGTIALFMARQAKHVTGIEYVPEAISDARENARFNGIENATFIHGDMAKVFNRELIATHGHPDIVIVDPPRAGMHPDVVKQLLDSSPERIVYVSCNPATQARDLKLMKETYRILKYNPLTCFHKPIMWKILCCWKRNQTNASNFSERTLIFTSRAGSIISACS